MEKLNFDLVHQAKLTYRQVSVVLGVHHITVTNWKRGKKHPHAYYAERLAQLNAAIMLGLETELLPLRGVEGLSAVETGMQAVRILRGLLQAVEGQRTNQ